MNDFIIYSHRNKINNKSYIGLTSNPMKRFCGKGSTYKRCIKFYNAIKKYGWNNFEHIVLFDGLSKEEAINMEIKMIALYDTTTRGYNISNGGEAFMLGYRFTEEQKLQMSISRKGRNKSKRCSIDSEYKKGHTFAPETLQKMSEAKKGKPTWNKGLKGYNSGDKNPMKRPEVVAKFIGKNNPMSKKILAYDINDNFIKEYDCMSDAAKELNVNVSNICACAKGRLKSTKGYKFIYPLSERP